MCFHARYQFISEGLLQGLHTPNGLQCAFQQYPDARRMGRAHVCGLQLPTQTLMFHRIEIDVSLEIDVHHLKGAASIPWHCRLCRASPQS
jgi:hypothetical protein